jgi:hypothetical protein
MYDVGPDTEPHNGTDECTDDGHAYASGCDGLGVRPL